MKRFAPLLLVALLFSPFFAFAQEIVDSRYCPNPETDFFKGSIYYENDKPWIEVKVDPDFEQKELREKRHIIGDIPLTPVYDLVVRIKPEFNYYCIPGWVDGAKVTAEQLPPFLHITAAIVVGVKDEPVVDPVVFSRTDEKDEQGRFVYERKIKGWMNGIASGAKMERLIAGSENAHALITIAKPDGDTEKIKSSVTFSNCAPFWGNGQHAIVGMRDSGTNAQDMVSYFDDVRKLGFAKIEPYASHQIFFSYFVDLKQAIEGSVTPIAAIALETKKAGLRIPTIKTQNNVLSQYISASSCPSGIYLLKTVAENNSLPWGLGGIALFGASVRGALIDTEGAQLVAGSRGASDVGIVYVHEFSHTFAGLNDEYVYRAESKNVGIPLRNCSINPFADFSLGGKLYGSTRYKGCSFNYVAGDKPSVRTYFHRPSDQSVMNKDGNEINVISCGYILAAIKGGDAKSYFPECAKMDGVIKDGIQASALYPFFAALERIFSPSSAGTQIAAVGGSGSSSKGQYLIVESFDPNNPWGELIEVVPDSQTITPQTTTTQPPASPAENLNINAESIFDTISVDLKVNGKDGPITVEKRDRIVLSWISEGATRCRGVWSKNDIKLSGTAAGRITRPVTIKIACINADGERVDDAVQVLVDPTSS